MSNTTTNNLFAKYSEHTNTSSSSSNSNVYVGVSPIKVLGINPNEEQLTEIIGDVASKFNTSYDLRKNYSEQMSRPLTIWVQDVEELTSPTIINYEITQEFIQSKNGKNVYFSDDGKLSYAVNEAMMPSWTQAPYIQCTYGQNEWYNLVYKLVKWEHNEETPFHQFLSDVKIDAQSIYEGNFDGLHQFVDYINSQDDENFGTVTAMYTAKVDTGENGDTVRQKILTRPEFIYYNYGKVTAKQLESLRKKEASQIAAGYQLSNNGYYISDNIDETLVVFNKDDHMKHIPDVKSNLDELLGLG